MKLPRVLKPATAKLETALTHSLLGEWPEDGRYRWAGQPEAIAIVLIEALHQHLASARIAYLFVEKMSKGNRTTLATLARASALVEYLGEKDFVLTVNWTAWKDLTSEQRIALVDHELCHGGVDPESSRYLLIDHDVEEFGQIVRRWGFWQDDLARFAKDVGVQLDLLAQSPGRT